MCSGKFYRDHCIYLPAMVGWFVFSAMLSSYNKVVFGKDQMNFPCPLLMTSVHFLIQWVFSFSASMVWPDFFGGYSVSSMPWKSFLLTSIPCGIVTSGDVGLSNMSLARISLAFYTMVKASAPIFVLISAYILGIERITIGLVLVVLLICAGELLTVEGEIDFDATGFVLCLGAAILSGMRWTIVQFSLQKLDPPLKTAIATMRVLSPSMFVSMLAISLAIEEPWNRLGGKYFDTEEDGMKTVGMAVLGGLLAICMIMCEFYLILKTNAIVLMIGGVLKEIVTIFVGVVAFGDNINSTNMAGFAVVFLGVILYKIIFHLQKKQQVLEEEKRKKPRVEYWSVNVDLADENVQMRKTLMMENDIEDEDEPAVEMKELESMEISDSSKWGGINRLRDTLDEEEG